MNPIEVHALAKSLGRTKALGGLDLVVRTGEVHAFLGPNGADKPGTELRRSLWVRRIPVRLTRIHE